MTVYKSYTVMQGDSISILANVFLGSWDISPLVTLNGLRYPYISDDPTDQYAHPKGSLQYYGGISSGATQFIVGNLNDLQINPLETIFVNDWTTGLNEPLIVNFVTNNGDGTYTINVTTNIVNSYSASALITLFVNQENVTTKVLKTGDILYVPDTVTGPLLNQTVSDGLGTDILLDDTGIIQKSNGSWLTVSGPDNVIQAVKLRLRTEFGALMLHPTYGNRLFEIIGEDSEQYYWNLAKTFCQRCITSDPRVEQVNNLSLSAELDNNSNLIILINGEVTIQHDPSQSFVLSTKIGGST